MFIRSSLLLSTIVLSLIRKAPVTLAAKPMSTNSSITPGMFSVAYVTAPTEDVAKTLAHGAVKNKLAACINVIPKIVSIYEWEGKINEDSEVLMMIKTRTSKIEDLTKYIREHHPYSVCEVISLPIQGGNEPYLKWIGDVVP